MNPTIDTFWTAYLNSLPEGTPLPPKGYEAWGFGRNSRNWQAAWARWWYRAPRRPPPASSGATKQRNEPLPEPGISASSSMAR
jgi:hypothetical protein